MTDPLYHWLLPANAQRKKPYVSTYRMTEAQAKEKGALERIGEPEYRTPVEGMDALSIVEKGGGAKR